MHPQRLHDNSRSMPHLQLGLVLELQCLHRRMLTRKLTFLGRANPGLQVSSKHRVTLMLALWLTEWPVSYRGRLKRSSPSSKLDSSGSRSCGSQHANLRTPMLPLYCPPTQFLSLLDGRTSKPYIPVQIAIRTASQFVSRNPQPARCSRTNGPSRRKESTISHR